MNKQKEISDLPCGWISGHYFYEKILLFWDHVRYFTRIILIRGRDIMLITHKWSYLCVMAHVYCQLSETAMICLSNIHCCENFCLDITQIENCYSCRNIATKSRSQQSIRRRQALINHQARARPTVISIQGWIVQQKYNCCPV